MFSMRKSLKGHDTKCLPDDMFKGCKAPATTNVNEAGTHYFSQVCTTHLQPPQMLIPGRKPQLTHKQGPTPETLTHVELHLSYEQSHFT